MKHIILLFTSLLSCAMAAEINTLYIPTSLGNPLAIISESSSLISHRNFFLQSSSSQALSRTRLDNIDVLDSAIVTGTEDDFLQKFSYTYDNNGNLTSRIVVEMPESIWQNNERLTRTYNSDGNMVFQLKEEWNESVWENYSQWTFSYDSAGNSTTILSQDWYGDSWNNYGLETTTYDSAGYINAIVQAYWGGSDWQNESRSVHTYNGGYLMISTSEYYEGSEWVSSSRLNYTYDNNGNMTTMLEEQWDGSDWQNRRRSTLSYNTDGNETSYLFEQWNGEEWQSGARITSTYDSNGNINTSVLTFWIGSDWLNLQRTTYTSADNGNITSIILESWDGVDWVMGDDSGDMLFTDQMGILHGFTGIRVDLYYSTLTTDIVEESVQISSFSLSQNYPNPFNPSTTISYSLPEQSDIKMTIYDVRGSEITTLFDAGQPAGSYELQWNGVNHAGNLVGTGVYFCRIEAGHFSETIKMVYLR